MMKTTQEILIQLVEMSWNIYWGLAFGFILSSLIRAFISTETISDKLGKDNLKSLSLATFFGGISSSLKRVLSFQITPFSLFTHYNYYFTLSM